MNEKKKTIMQAATKLFAKKGFDATSIQEIASESGISKGAFYLHFRSKEELILAIFQYFAERLERRLSKVEQENLSPRDKLARQLEEQLLELLEQREVMLLQMREQILYMNADIEQFFRELNMNRMTWYESHLLEVYGKQIAPHVTDISRLFEGMVTAYIKLMLKKQLTLDVHQLAGYIVRRLDDIVHGIMACEETPILQKETLIRLFGQVAGPLQKSVSQLLLEMEQTLNHLPLDVQHKRELYDTLNFLLAEIKKEKPKKFIFKGMLANFEEVEALRPYKQKIANIMGL